MSVHPKSIDSPADVIAALERGDDDALLNVEESIWLDAKGEPYSLHRNDEKWELAKDISAMANAKGGLLVIAARTTKPETHLEERITKVVPVPAAKINVEQHLDTIKSWTFPSLAHRVHPHLFERGTAACC